MNEAKTESKKLHPIRRSYAPARVLVYGTIRTLTQYHASMTGMNDGQMSGTLMNLKSV